MLPFAGLLSCGGDGPTEPEGPIATKLALAVAPPATTPSGVPLATQPVVQLQSATGAPVARGQVSVTASVQGAPLVGSVTVKTGADGKAVFGDLGVGGAVGSRTIVFSSGTLQPVSHALSVTAGPAGTLAATGPLNQPGLVGEPVPFPPAVKVTDAGGNVVAGVSVTFAVASGGGTVTGASVESGADGIATVGSWTLGPATGANTVTASAAGLAGSPMTFTANGLLLMPTTMGANSEKNQTAPVNGPVPIPPAVWITGFQGTPVAGVPVTFQITEGNGTLTGADALSDENGIATVGSWVLGNVGANAVTATSPGLTGSPIEFRATGTQLGTITAGLSPGFGIKGTAASPLPSVTLKDGNGAPVAGLPVTFTVVLGGGSITGAEQVTGADGVATLGSWILGPNPGTNQVRADGPPGYAGGPHLFTTQALSTPPVSIAKHAGDGQEAQVATAVPVRPAVIVKDAMGQPVEGYPVTFATSQPNGTVTGGETLTDVQGVATVGSWTLPQQSGPYELEAWSSIGAVNFTATARPGPAASIAPAAAVDATGTVGQAALVNGSPAGARVADAYGNAVAGVSVTFSVGVVAGPGSSVSGTPQLTDASGIARAIDWTLGTTSGTYEVKAAAAGLTPTTLRAQAAAGPPTAMVLSAGDGQVGGVRRFLPVNPAMQVRDQYGNTTQGTVTFAVTGGGGSGGGAIPANASGIAAAKWKLGTLPGINTMRATLNATGATYDFTATATPVTSDFDIELRYLSAVTPQQQAVFDAAAARWSDIILGDVAPTTANIAADACFDGQPAMNEPVDDVIIFVELVNIDGVGSVLGAAGPCLVRLSSGLPGMGLIRLDIADFNDMAASGELPDVVLHEMGHVIGIGTVWDRKNLVFGAGTSNPTYVGAAGVGQYRGMGGSLSAVPVENTGGPGTADAHWREVTFGPELMTGYIGGSLNPLTRMTIGSLQDLGYSVDYGTADTLTFTPQLRRAQRAPRLLREIPLSSPILVVDPSGRVVEERARKPRR